MIKKRFFALLLVILQVINIIPITAHTVNEFDEENLNRLGVSISESVNSSLSFLSASQNEDGDWYEYDKLRTADIAKVLKYIVSINQDNTLSLELLDNVELFFEYESVQNVDDLANWIITLQSTDDYYYSWLVSSQNPDGGFGLAENYASDIIDTKLALKALADLDETEAMTKAALYIASLQNADGGFSYQKGLPSNPELTCRDSRYIQRLYHQRPVVSVYFVRYVE